MQTTINTEYDIGQKVRTHDDDVGEVVNINITITEKYERYIEYLVLIKDKGTMLFSQSCLESEE